ncbi:MAG: CPBP family intramembrane metalloprotease [Bacteroidetes bacterium]|nr:MAG: CPBP family intramembrane metalloprotease [Bacteroidota bacterium]
MLGLLVIIIVSWVLLHFFEKKNIEVLGVIPNKQRSIQFLIGFIFVALICLLSIYIERSVLNVEWKKNASINYSAIFNSFIYHLRSALTEDLVFRGAILYILISKVGAKWAILISALCFGVYHVFSYGMTGERIIPILYVILVTGFTGYVWAYTFHKTKSIMMALGFHLGYNFLMAMFYESPPQGELIFTELSKIELRDWNWLLYNVAKGLLPSILTLVFVKQYLKYSPNRKEEIV